MARGQQPPDLITASAAGLESTLLRQAFSCFPSGVTSLCAMVDDSPSGMAASSFTSVSMEPALVAVCIATTSTTWPGLATAPRIGLSVLGSGHGAVARRLASKNGDRFADVQWTATDSGAVYVHNSPLWLECRLYDVVGAGDHDIVILRIEGLSIQPDVQPMVFHRSHFHELRPMLDAAASRSVRHPP